VIVENIGLDPTGPWFSLFQKGKILPLLVGNQYKVHLRIRVKSPHSSRDVRLSLGMWIKQHGEYKLKREGKLLPDPPEIAPNQPCYDVKSKKPYLMRDTGASDLEIRAYTNGQRLTLQEKRRKKNQPTQTLVYAYHVEPWRTSVLAILISATVLALALLSWH
jgi:hypothetical protein